MPQTYQTSRSWSESLLQSQPSTYVLRISKTGPSTPSPSSPEPIHDGLFNQLDTERYWSSEDFSGAALAISFGFFFDFFIGIRPRRLRRRGVPLFRNRHQLLFHCFSSF